MLCDPDDPALCGGQNFSAPEVSGDPFSCADDVISEASVISVPSFEPRTEDRPVIALDSSDEEESCAVTLVSPSTAKRPAIEETDKNPAPSPVVQGELVAVNCYRQHFADRHHFNLVGHDRAGEPVLMSFTSEENHFRVLLWLSSGTRYRLIPVGELGPNPSPTALARQVCEQVTVERFRPVTSPADWRLISRFEEEVELTKFKFVVWTTNATTPRVNDVLSALVQRVTKREGIAVYTVFQDRDIKLRVTKMGNGETMQPLVAMIIQEETAALPPEHGNLHTVILVQPFGSNAYNVRVATRDEPLVQETFKQSDAMKVFILTELIKAEIASKAREVRMPLLRQLVVELDQNSREFLGVGFWKRISEVVPTPEHVTKTLQRPAQQQIQDRSPPDPHSNTQVHILLTPLDGGTLGDTGVSALEVEPDTLESVGHPSPDEDIQQEENGVLNCQPAVVRAVRAVSKRSCVGRRRRRRRKSGGNDLRQRSSRIAARRSLLQPREDGDSSVPKSPLEKLELMGNIRCNQKDCWAGNFAIRHAFPAFPNLDCSTLAKIIEIVGFSIDHVAKASRTECQLNSGSVPKWAVERLVTGTRYSFVGNQKPPKLSRRSSNYVNILAVRARFLQFFPAGTKVAADTRQFLASLTSDFVVHLSAQVEKVCPSSDKLEFEHIVQALANIGFGFLLEPDGEQD